MTKKDRTHIIIFAGVIALPIIYALITHFFKVLQSGGATMIAIALYVALVILIGAATSEPTIR